ncbi:hypothetical protein F5Y06DRAFT_281853 [Hypoxylon sp. FL0890]|nr:hypothetical protein F5Y06DRAFT_281853 [Hypoxylon sp. FL0890]
MSMYLMLCIALRPYACIVESKLEVIPTDGTIYQSVAFPPFVTEKCCKTARHTTNKRVSLPTPAIQLSESKVTAQCSLIGLEFLVFSL